MKKVLIVANSDIGLYKFRRELVEELLKSNEVFIMLPMGEFVERFVSIGCHYINCEFDRHGTNPLSELSLIRLYKKTVKSIRPDIVLTYTIKPNVYAGMVCARENIPYVANVTGLGTAVEDPGVLQKLTTTLYRYGLRKARKVFFQNQENLDFMLARKVVSDNYELIPGSGVNLEQYSPLPYPEGETVHFLFIARIMKEKGIDQYLDAAKYIRQKYPNTQFHICGFCETDYYDKLVELQEAGTIVYHGQVSDMLPFYKMASCVIHPTYYPEGMSNVLLESCASARPIITTDRAGCREIVEDGRNGYITKQKDSEDLIKQIEKFMQLTREQRAEMGRLGREKVQKEFDRKIVIEKYLKEVSSNG